MSKDNKYQHQIGEGLTLLREALSPYVRRQLRARYKDAWWREGAEPHVRSMTELRSRLERAKSDDERFGLLDIQALLTILNNVWGEAFQADLGQAGRNYANELRDYRNRWAHQGDFTIQDAYRFFDTTTRLLEMIAAPQRAQTGETAQAIMIEINDQDRRATPALFQTRPSSAVLRPWREIATPHPDVSAGRYQQAEFAADLYQVITGRASAEYADPKQFFERTYFTEGLSQLLSRAWLRLNGTGGDPVVELQTNFGGGKTHSMLALYHLFGGQIEPSEISGINKITKLMGSSNPPLPKVKWAVLACNHLAVDSPWAKSDGTEIHTLWGEMAWQLGGKQGYDMVAEADRQGVSPGGKKLIDLFERFGPALVLIDEWVVYARMLIGKEGLPAGTFDANMSFVQSLTEAAKATKHTLVVAAIPASEIEVGGENGQFALGRIRNVFSRVEAIWKPASAEEAFEIVRRRLFEPLSDKAIEQRNAVCKAYATLYSENRGDFPPECYELTYEERLKSAYPIHPELFDRLYQDWSTLERFQLTRGVLRLMATVIHELWMRGDSSLMIQPGTVPLDSQTVRTEFSRHLPDGWNAVLDKDVDGSQSRTLILDQQNPALGRFSACRRVARTVFIGSAPTTGAQRARGILEVRVKLGCAQPGETPATFGDALNRLTEQLTYLYLDAAHYWYDTHPTITRIAADRAAQFEHKSDLIEDEITRRVREMTRSNRGDFTSVHAMPNDGSDVPDESSCRLVILRPNVAHRSNSQESPALEAAQNILDKRGNVSRQYRNMLVFLASDADRLTELRQAVQNWLAWTSIQQEKDSLNLDANQLQQVSRQIKRYEDAITAQIMETYSYLLVPTQDGTSPMEWQVSRLQGGESLVLRAARKLLNEQTLITEWSPTLLRMELDRNLWKNQDYLSVRQIWEYLAQYLYLPRLKNSDVLVKAIRSGVGSLNWVDYFAYAASVNTENHHFVGLVTSAMPDIYLDGQSVLVKPEVAARQREAERQAETPIMPVQGVEHPIGEPRSETDISATQQTVTIIRRFHGSVELDPTRPGRDAGRVADEVISHLTGLVGAKARIILEIQVDVPGGIPEDKIRTINENCNTLKFKEHGFEES